MSSISPIRRCLIDPLRARSENIVRTAKSAAPLALCAAAGAAAYHVSPGFHGFADHTRTFVNQYPQIFEMASAGFFTGALPDFLAQRYGGEKFKFGRFIGMTIAGSIMNGLVLRKFYNQLRSSIPGTAFWPTELKIGIDQIFYSPLNLAVYFTISNLLERKAFSYYWTRLWETTKKVMPLSWIYWGLLGAQAIYRTPPDLQIYLVCFLSVIWYSILSNMMHENMGAASSPQP